MAAMTSGFGKVTAAQKMLLGILLLVGFGAAFYFLIYSPKHDQLAGKDDERAAVEGQLQAALRQYQQWQQLTQDVEAAKKLLQSLNDLLPTTRDVEGLMTGINAKARDAQLRLTNIVPEEEQEDESGMYVRIPIKIEFRGTFHQVLHFLYLVDSGIKRLVNIENIQLDDLGDTDAPGMLKGSMLATTFMAKEKESDQATSK
ncbi:MAG: type 4a pilus biogenesis protein PilO [Deltaproteobacteria bacterium]|nr:type 4a pilus biogenesis protein PilO [Deltaproteobacteria bacterium]